MSLRLLVMRFCVKVFLNPAPELEVEVPNPHLKMPSLDHIDERSDEMTALAKAIFSMKDEQLIVPSWCLTTVF